jgi:uncharacterized protein (DUF2126 family)
MELTLRNALEPWHVMGEEGASGGTVRYVDSSLERIEVKVTGLNESRYVVTVQRPALPLQSTGTTGEFVAGVRYRAWNPPSALHPTIGEHAPLTFDMVDTWMNRSVAAASTTWRTRAAATTTPSRSTPTRPKAGACRASSAWATRRACCRCRRRRSTCRAAASSRSRWTCVRSSTRPRAARYDFFKPSPLPRTAGQAPRVVFLRPR